MLGFVSLLGDNGKHIAALYRPSTVSFPPNSYRHRRALRTVHVRIDGGEWSGVTVIRRLRTLVGIAQTSGGGAHGGHRSKYPGFRDEASNQTPQGSTATSVWGQRGGGTHGVP